MTPRDRYVRPTNLPGEVFIPRARGAKKNPCPDCFECQWCSDARCEACCGGCRRKKEAGSREPESSGGSEGGG